MKTTILKISLIFLLLLTMGAGCEKDEDFLELPIGAENPVILKEVDGIEFKFCLLNEQGEPATVFNEGENFTFDFEFKNLTYDSISFSLSFINDDFFRIRNDNKDYEKSWQSVLCEFASLPEYFSLQKGETSILQLPWVITNKFKGSIYPFCPSSQKEFLTLGNYYTQFELNFLNINPIMKLKELMG